MAPPFTIMDKVEIMVADMGRPDHKKVLPSLQVILQLQKQRRDQDQVERREYEVEKARRKAAVHVQYNESDTLLEEDAKHAALEAELSAKRAEIARKKAVHDALEAAARAVERQTLKELKAKQQAAREKKADDDNIALAIIRSLPTELFVEDFAGAAFMQEILCKTDNLWVAKDWKL